MCKISCFKICIDTSLLMKICLIIFLLYNGAKAIGIQQKLHVEFWYFPKLIIYNMILSTHTGQWQGTSATISHTITRVSNQYSIVYCVAKLWCLVVWRIRCIFYLWYFQFTMVLLRYKPILRWGDSVFLN
jgi:hypothetical protein